VVWAGVPNDISMINMAVAVELLPVTGQKPLKAAVEVLFG
jgi:hypothetical protein